MAPSCANFCGGLHKVLTRPKTTGVDLYNRCAHTVTMSSPQRTALARLIVENPNLDPTGGDGAALGRRAGFSERTAKQQVSRCMKDPRFLAMIDRVRSEQPDSPAQPTAVPTQKLTRDFAIGATDLADIRRRTVARMLQLAEQDENLNVTYKACEWLGRYTAAIDHARAKMEAEQKTVGDEGMDLETAKAVREAARMAA